MQVDLRFFVRLLVLALVVTGSASAADVFIMTPN